MSNDVIPAAGAQTLPAAVPAPVPVQRELSSALLADPAVAAFFQEAPVPPDHAQAMVRWYEEQLEAGTNVEDAEAFLDRFWLEMEQRGVPEASAVRAVKWLLDTFAANAPAEPSAVEQEMAQIQALMRNRGSDYWRGPRAAILQARYRELIEMKEAD